MRNKSEHIRRAVVLILAVAGLIVCTAPFSVSSGLAFAQAAAPSWSYTGSLVSSDDAGPATLLPNGKVLVVGGINGELYDPATGTWSITAGLNTPRSGPTATLLQNGKVLVTGGTDSSFFAINSAELYDPATGAWSLTGSFNMLRIGPTATLLQNGKVLVAGGQDDSVFHSATDTAELYDPNTGTWSVTGRLKTTRVGHTATLLQNGKVLVAGGLDDGDFSVYRTELYDPTTGTWSITGTLNAGRGGHTATLLPNGNVLLTGACNDGIFCPNTSSAELYNPASGSWSPTHDLNTSRFFHTATLLPDGRVLIAGGEHINFFTGTEVFLNTAEIYDPATGTWSTTANLNGPRLSHTATLLQNGKVLVVGGSRSVLGNAELYDSGATSTSSPTPTPTSTPTPTPTATPTLRTNGKIAFTSDRDGNLEIYVMNPDGSNQVRITSNNVTDACPTWSPDGRKIAFVSQKQDGGFAIFTMNADGAGRTEVTPLNGKRLVEAYDSVFTRWRLLSWSPNGGRIAFHDYSDLSESIDIFVVNADGSGRQNLTADHARFDGTPTWSPDGSKILFSRYDGYPPVGYFGTMLHAINVDGTNLTRLENGFADGWNEDAPDWSPAVNKIVYSVNRWDFVFDLYIANPDGTARQFFHGCDWTDNSCKLDALTPVFSPDGTKIAFSMFDFLNNTPQELYVKNLDGTGLVLLTNNGASPSWQPLVPAAVCSNTIDCPDFFVRQHYRDFLNRDADGEGLAFWTNQITSCGSDQACIEVKRINDSGSFFLSIEFQETGYLVYRMYKTAYGNLPNAPVPITFSEFIPDTQAIGRDVIVNQPGWEQVIENNKRIFTAQFVARPRFTAAFTPAMSAQEFVDKLNGNAGNPLSQTERDQLVSDLSGGRRSRADVIRAIAENPKLAQAEFNHAFVLMQYFGYLRRNPNDAPDGNFVGYNFWLTKLNSFNGDFNQAEMVKAFIESSEYRRRFGQ